MPTYPLPDDPNLAQLRKQARDLQRAVRAGESRALDLAAEHHPGGEPADLAGWKLSSAQLVIARLYGFASWPALTRHLRVIDTYRWAPDRAGPSPDPATEFLRRACLTYSDTDGQQRSAAPILLEHPGLARTDIWVAAACADADAVARLLRQDPHLATRAGGPHGCTPISYLAYARHDPTLTADAVTTTAGLLLAGGADPDTGFLWHGLAPAFTLLTGAFGEGEQGPVAQPRHPAEHALARRLLRAGADPNDGQALYNRMFLPADDHLELLFEFGLGEGDGGPWRRRLGDRLDSPARMLATQLGWAIMHGFTHRVALLADHGADLDAPVTGYGVHEPNAYQAALLSGQQEVARLLAGRGAEVTSLPPEQAVLAAVLAADRAAVDRLVAQHPDVVARARSGRPGLVVWATARASGEAVRLAVELGWDVSVKARSDVPSDQQWETALHCAAGQGDAAMVTLLLSLGADPAIRDERFDATPLDWARHGGHDEVAGLLADQPSSSSR